MVTAPFVSIVDDDESVRLATASLIRSLGWSAQVYASADAFLRSNACVSTACVVCDIQMPGMTGLEMQAQLIANGMRLPIIFVTAFPSDATRRRASENGARYFLHKPIDAAEFTRCLQSILGSGETR
ncbi:response regulator transcription factor [Paraburkholderia solisilvae]|uniref:Response regulator protein TodT n=1 Tax=Paraburkholderia solisilvae TaxID=624376 RepID=A0A6J5DGB2_9BURK|nr:Response regulator protein TodT [Paraburkholderia solisilvae]